MARATKRKPAETPSSDLDEQDTSLAKKIHRARRESPFFLPPLLAIANLRLIIADPLEEGSHWIGLITGEALLAQTKRADYVLTKARKGKDEIVRVRYTVISLRQRSDDGMR